MQAKGFNPTHQLVRPVVGIGIGDGEVSFSHKLVKSMIVYVRTCRRGLKEFSRACNAAGVHFRPNDNPVPVIFERWGLPAPLDGINAFEVYATAGDLMTLAKHSSVLSFHAISKFDDVRAAGSGKAK